MSAVVFANQKGGVGKSTISVLFAQHAADKCGERVCVIDLDAQANASKSLKQFGSGVEATQLFRTADVATAPDAPGQIVLFAGTKALVDLERDNPAEILPAFVQQVRRLTQRFDTCVIDTPPALGLRMSAALMAADHACCPIELEEYSIDGVTDMLRTILGVRQRYNAKLQMLGIVPNRFNAHSPRQKAALEHLLASYSDFVLPAKLSTRSSIPEALAAGVPVWRLAKSSAREASAEVLHLFQLLRKKMAATGEAAAAAASAEAAR